MWFKTCLCARFFYFYITIYLNHEEPVSNEFSHLSCYSLYARGRGPHYADITTENFCTSCIYENQRRRGVVDTCYALLSRGRRFDSPLLQNHFRLSRHEIHTQIINTPGPVLVTTQGKTQKGCCFFLKKGGGRKGRRGVWNEPMPCKTGVAGSIPGFSIKPLSVSLRMLPS